jgi:hypothetical protein
MITLHVYCEGKANGLYSKPIKQASYNPMTILKNHKKTSQNSTKMICYLGHFTILVRNEHGRKKIEDEKEISQWLQEQHEGRPQKAALYPRTIVQR